MRQLVLSLVLVILTVGLYGQEVQIGDPCGFQLRNGDLLFQEKGSDSFTDAIEGATRSIGEYNFSHVGVFYSENGEGYVLEAISDGVSKTPFETFLQKSKQINGKPIVVVARVKKRYEKYIPEALERMNALVGKSYDMEFAPDNDMYYCSELVYVSYLKRGGRHIFKSLPMSFKDKSTGEMSPFWIEHFEMLKKPIPEGVMGTNPGDMSRSNKIKIINAF